MLLLLIIIILLLLLLLLIVLLLLFLLQQLPEALSRHGPSSSARRGFGSLLHRDHRSASGVFPTHGGCWAVGNGQKVGVVATRLSPPTGAQTSSILGLPKCRFRV